MLLRGSFPTRQPAVTPCVHEGQYRWLLAIRSLVCPYVNTSSALQVLQPNSLNQIKGKIFTLLHLWTPWVFRPFLACSLPAGMPVIWTQDRPLLSGLEGMKPCCHWGSWGLFSINSSGEECWLTRKPCGPCLPQPWSHLWPYCVACRILLPNQGLNLGPLAVREHSPNHCTTREFPNRSFKAQLRWCLFPMVFHDTLSFLHCPLS